MKKRLFLLTVIALLSPVYSVTAQDVVIEVPGMTQLIEANTVGEAVFQADSPEELRQLARIARLKTEGPHGKELLHSIEQGAQQDGKFEGRYTRSVELLDRISPDYLRQRLNGSMKQVKAG